MAITEVNYGQIDSDIYPPRGQDSHVIHNPVMPNMRNLNFEFAMDLDSDLRNRRAIPQIDAAQQIEAVRLLCQQQRRRRKSAGGRLSTSSDDEPTTKSCVEPYLNTEIYDTFEQCLHVTNQMESVMAYHYQDENNKNCYRFEEIYAFREGDINICNLLSDLEESKTESLIRPRSLSLGDYMRRKSHIKEDLEEFVEHKSEVLIKEQQHEEMETSYDS